MRSPFSSLPCFRHAYGVLDSQFGSGIADNPASILGEGQRIKATSTNQIDSIDIAGPNDLCIGVTISPPLDSAVAEVAFKLLHLPYYGAITGTIGVSRGDKVYNSTATGYLAASTDATATGAAIGIAGIQSAAGFTIPIYSLGL